jgi:hypothetical protein
MVGGIWIGVSVFHAGPLTLRAQTEQTRCPASPNIESFFSCSLGLNRPPLPFLFPFLWQVNNEVAPKSRQTVFNTLRRWKQIDISITEAFYESKDNVKYLTTLEKFIEPLYTGTPTTIVDNLNALMNSVKMIHTIARWGGWILSVCFILIVGSFERT